MFVASMVPSLISNHLYVATAPRSSLYNPRTTGHRPTVCAKSAENSSSSPFSFDWAKLGGGVQSLVPVVPSNGLSLGLQQRRKDPGTVFVAGATGQAGIRIAQTLLREGFTVRAGVPDLGSAQELARLASQYKILSGEESRRLNAVASTFEDTTDSIAKAIGNAAKVVVTIGPSENGPTAEVTTNDALRVIEAAQLAKVGHVVIVFDDSLANVSTYNVLDGITSFFSNLFSKSQALTLVEFLQNLVETDVDYTVIKTKLTEDFSPESSYGLAVASEGSSAAANDYKVARSKIASLVAQVFSNTSISQNKVVEVYSDPSGRSKSIDELLRDIPEDTRRKVYLESVAKAKAEEEARQASAQAARKLEEKATQSPNGSIAGEAQKRAEASVEELLSKAKSINLGVSWDELSSRLQSAVAKAVEEPKVEVATVRGTAKARSLPSLKAVVKGSSSSSSPLKKSSKGKQQTEVKKKETAKKTATGGGWFKQETIFVDDD